MASDLWGVGVGSTDDFRGQLYLLLEQRKNLLATHFLES